MSQPVTADGPDFRTRVPKFYDCSEHYHMHESGLLDSPSLWVQCYSVWRTVSRVRKTAALSLFRHGNATSCAWCCGRSTSCQRSRFEIWLHNSHLRHSNGGISGSSTVRPHFLLAGFAWQQDMIPLLYAYFKCQRVE